MKLTRKQRRMFPRIQRKYPVSKEFLVRNKEAIWNFYCYALCPRLVIKPIAVRKQRTQRVFIRYYHLRRVLFDQTQRKRIKARKRSAQLWSRAMVCYLKSTNGIEEFVESVYENDRTVVMRINTEHIADGVADDAKVQKEAEAGEETQVAELTQLPTPRMAAEEVSKQLREQLALLRTGKRSMTLIEGSEEKEIRRAAEPSKNVMEIDATDVAIKLVEVVDEQPVTEVTLTQGTVANVSDHEHVDDVDIEANKVLKPAAQKTDLAEESSHNDISNDQGEEKTATEENENSPNSLVNKSKVNEITIGPKEPDVSTAEQHQKTSTKAPQQIAAKKPKSNHNFLDMLMNKVRVRNFSELLHPPPTLETLPPPSPRDEHEMSLSPTKESAAVILHNSSYHENDHSHSTDSCEEFLGFEDSTERVPGMLHTPIVPCRSKAKAGVTSSAFISESLNEYMRENNLVETADNTAEADTSSAPRHRQAENLAGLVTPGCIAPPMQMPAVPESLQRLRTVAERRQYLQRFAKNHKMAIINNEATIYRELQRKVIQHKAKSVAQQLAQAPNSQMPFTRNGWQAASFCATEFNKYYYQTLYVDKGSASVKLPGVRGNNEERNKRAYTSRASGSVTCSPNCADFLVWRDFKAIKTYVHKTKLNRTPLPALFRPCPLSYKPLQRPLDDDTAALLLAGGSMAVVRMPTVELQVFPELGKPLHEIAKRYLQYILPHHDISREWAEFSVSTLQQPASRTMNAAAEEAAAAAVVASGRRKSFTFAIPYLNDRQHILVRRVVDRSEKLDQSFEQAPEESCTRAVTMADLSFRSKLDESDELLMECADVLGDMINSVAISCSENSFIKEDPHSLYVEKNKMALTTVVSSNQAAPNPAREISEKAEAKHVPPAHSAQHKKQNRLLCELRRLNATIIDAAAKTEKEAKPCSKEYCALGCVCSSLVDDYPLRQHCGKSKCVLECNCKGLTQSRIMRLETDGRSITTEDAFMLRRKATARLARMEKEFTSTIVLTENETLLINESQYDKKRRCTKAPKRYEDFADTDDDFQRTPPKKNSSAVVTIEASEDNAFAEVATELREPIYVKDTTLDQLKHCTVSLVPFEETKNMAVWCMVHELYKCYCGGRATDGKPLFIEKEEVNTSVNESNSTVNAGYVTMAAPKARYSFEKLEEEHKEEERYEPEEFILPEEYPPSNADEPQDEEEQAEEEEEDHDNYTDEESEESSSVDDTTADPDVFLPKLKKRGRPAKLTVTVNKNHSQKRGRPYTVDIIQDYFKAKPNSCRRAVAVPHKTYTRLNRKRLPKIYDYINSNENARTRLLLNEHILRSVYYHKHELEKQRKVECATSKPQKTNEVDVKPSDKTVVKTEEKSVEFLDEESRQSSVASSSTSSKRSKPSKRVRKRNRSRASQSVTLPDKSQEIERNSRDSSEPFSIGSTKTTKITETEDVSALEPLVRDHKLAEDTVSTSCSSPTSIEKPPSSNIDATTIQVPKISGCFSLNDNDENVNNHLQDVISNSPTPSSSQSVSVSADITSATNDASTQSTARALGLEDVSISKEIFKEFYNGVIKNMNNLVSKKMQDIDMALKRESKVIPTPNNDILCIIKWSNFLDAFNQGFIFIWEVKVKDHSFFAATISNMMPMVLGAMGVVNIAAMDANKLPLMGRMLVEGHRSEKTWKLAIVMQGRTHYWLVKGFLRPDVSSACAKPHPQTHPVLTQKINVLCGLLIKQKIKEYHRKLQQKHDEDAARLMQNRPLIARAIPPLVAPISPTIRQQPQHSSKSDAPTNKKQTAVNQVCSSNEPLSKRFKQQQIPQQLVPPTMATSSVSQDSAAARRAQKSKQVADLKSSFAPNMAASSLSSSNSSPSNASLLRDLRAQSEYTNMKSNIEFRKVNQDDIKEIYQPEQHTNDHRWLVLDLYNDFSHIFVPDFHDLVSLDRIQKVMSFSRTQGKIVKLQFFQNAAFDAFVTPSSSRKIYFGPLKLNMRPPLLILLQSVDGKMMCREIYQQQHNIPSKLIERTTAFWILQIGGQMHFEIEEIETPELPTPPLVPIRALPQLLQQQQPPEQPPQFEDPDSDEDCMIVEESTSPPERRSSEDLGQLCPNSEESSMEAAVYPPTSLAENYPTDFQSHLINAFNEPKPTSLAETHPTDLKSQPIKAVNEPKHSQRINFTIQSKANASGLQITTIPDIESTNMGDHQTSNAEQLISCFPPQTAITTLQSGPILQLSPPNISQHGGFVPILNLPSAAVITSTELAPKDAPYGSTIYISNVQPDTGTTMEQSNITVNPTTIYSNNLGTVTTPAIQPPISNSMNPKQAITLSSIVETMPVSTKSAPIKRRRVSLRCPTQANNETTNIAIDAVLKLMPTQPQEQLSKIVVISGAQEKEVSPELASHTAELLPAKSAPTALSPPYPNFANSNISTIGCTTITKLLDCTAMPGRTMQTAKLSAVLDNSVKTSKTAANITVEPVINGVDLGNNLGDVFLNEITGEVQVLQSIPTTTGSVSNNLQETSPSTPPVINVKSKRLLMADSNVDTAALKSKRRRLTAGHTSSVGSDGGSTSKNATPVATADTTSISLDGIKFPVMPSKISATHSRKDSKKLEPPVPPMVFDVNFMDSADEPAASILIKQTSPLKSREMVPLSLANCPSIMAKLTAATTTPTSSTTTNTSTVTSLSQTTPPVIKTIKRRMHGVLPAAHILKNVPLYGSGAVMNSAVASGAVASGAVASGAVASGTVASGAVKLPATALHILKAMPLIGSGTVTAATSTSTVTAATTVTPLGASKKLCSTLGLESSVPSPTTAPKTYVATPLKLIAPKLPTATMISAKSAATAKQVPQHTLITTLPAPPATPLVLPLTQQLKMTVKDAPKVGCGPKLQQRLLSPAAVVASTSSSISSATIHSSSGSNSAAIARIPSPIFNVRQAVPPVSASQRHGVPVKLNINQQRLKATTMKTVKVSATGLAAAAASSTEALVSAAGSTNAPPTPTVAATAIKPAAEYGYFCCNLPNAPKFVGKRVRDYFLIKVPKLGTVRFAGGKTGPINTYLNQIMAKTDPNFTKPVNWQFVTQKGLKPTVTDASHSHARAVGGSRVQNITVRRRLNAAPRATSSATTTSAKAMANATAAASTNVHSDTILIED